MAVEQTPATSTPAKWIAYALIAIGLVAVLLFAYNRATRPTGLSTAPALQARIVTEDGQTEAVAVPVRGGPFGGPFLAWFANPISALIGIVLIAAGWSMASWAGRQTPQPKQPPEA